jgi:hypothetical protein
VQSTVRGLFDTSLLYRASARVPCIQEDTNSNLDRRLSPVSFDFVTYLTIYHCRFFQNLHRLIIHIHPTNFILDLLTSNPSPLYYFPTVRKHILIVNGLRTIAHGGWIACMCTHLCLDLPSTFVSFRFLELKCCKRRHFTFTRCVLGSNGSVIFFKFCLLKHTVSSFSVSARHTTRALELR